MEKTNKFVLEIFGTQATTQSGLSIPAAQVMAALDALKPKTLDGVFSSVPL
jgi:hypothetical protein